MGSSHLLHTHKPTIVFDSNGKPIIRLSSKLDTRPDSDQINEVCLLLDEDKTSFATRLDSIEESNRRGCDEIMF